MVVNYIELLCLLKRSKGIDSLRAGTQNIRSGRFINIGKVKWQLAGVPGCILTPAANSKPPWKVPSSCKAQARFEEFQLDLCLSIPGPGQAPRGRGRRSLHQRGQELRHHLEAGPVVHDHAAQDQEADPGRWGTLLTLFRFRWVMIFSMFVLEQRSLFKFPFNVMKSLLFSKFVNIKIWGRLREVRGYTLSFEKSLVASVSAVARIIQVCHGPTTCSLA